MLVVSSQITIIAIGYYNTLIIPIGGSDYEDNPIPIFTIVNINNTRSIVIPLIKDNSFEESENFVANLSLVGPPSPIVQIDPAVTNIVISDDDSKQFS